MQLSMPTWSLLNYPDDLKIFVNYDFPVKSMLTWNFSD
ncbi:hypothetical protein SLEP1_g22747 [Rubroshorea leprosula]|uniref:Uncharacterized protein n=1 Tax=Rubroshorea leprosula TaxID=152421 RepID=A0AAV5JL23_9ROSI|nr:hypothetical protein SLEP1_g22747 [Rubroshorea leprosula]